MQHLRTRERPGVEEDFLGMGAVRMRHVAEDAGVADGCRHRQAGSRIHRDEMKELPGVRLGGRQIVEAGT